MTTILIILASLLWALSFFALRGRQILAPPLSFCALLLLSFVKSGGYPVLPINTTILTSWFCMTMVVMFIIILQTEKMRQQTRGNTSMIIGGLAGLATGLLGYTLTTSISMRYGVMILGVIIGIFCGFLLYSRTPEGNKIRIGTGHFHRYLLAKGFPTAITIIQAGIALVLTIALYER